MIAPAIKQINFDLKSSQTQKTQVSLSSKQTRHFIPDSYFELYSIYTGINQCHGFVAFCIQFITPFKLIFYSFEKLYNYSISTISSILTACTHFLMISKTFWYNIMVLRNLHPPKKALKLFHYSVKNVGNVHPLKNCANMYYSLINVIHSIIFMEFNIHYPRTPLFFHNIKCDDL